MTNTTGRPLTRLRFRIADISTVPAASGRPDLRALSSATTTVNVNGDPVTLQGTTVEEPPAQSMGGGVNSTFSVPSVTAATPLAPGATIYVQIVFGIQQDGNAPPVVDLTTESLPLPIPAPPNRPPAVIGAGPLFVRLGGVAQPHLSVRDPDAGASDVQAHASVTRGTMTFAAHVTAAFTEGGELDTHSFTLRGTLDEINAALSTVYYRPNVYFPAADTLTLTVNDLGASGSGGALETTVTVPISISNGAEALAIAGGLTPAESFTVTMLDTEPDGRLTIVDAVRQEVQAANGYGGVVTVSPATRTSAGVVFLDDAALSGQPNARVMAAHDYQGAYFPSPLAVYYDGLSGRWCVVAESGAPIPDGERLFYARYDKMKRVERPASGNFRPHATLLDDPSLASNPQEPVLAQHEWRVSAITSPLGLWYYKGLWYVYDEDQSTQATGQAFIYAAPGSAGGRVTRTASNAYGTGGVYLDDPRLNGRPGAVVIAQHKYELKTVPSPMAVWYNLFTGKWVAYNENTSVPFPDGESVDYWVVR